MKMYDNNKDQQTSGRTCRFGKLAILAIALLTVSGLAGLASVTAQGEGEKEIHAKESTFADHECDDTEWHFVINQIDKDEDAPASINVTWANGTQADINMSKRSGKVAHYNTTMELNSTVTNATAVIYAGWSGQFNLSHGPCEEEREEEEGVPCPDLTVTAEAGPANQLNWTAVEGADNYTVYRSTDGENFTVLSMVDNGTLSYEDSAVEQGQTYWYTVTATVGEEESEDCDVVEVTSIPVFSTTFVAVAAGILGLGGYALVQRKA